MNVTTCGQIKLENQLSTSSVLHCILCSIIIIFYLKKRKTSKNTHILEKPPFQCTPKILFWLCAPIESAREKTTKSSVIPLGTIAKKNIFGEGGGCVWGEGGSPLYVICIWTIRVERLRKTLPFYVSKCKCMCICSVTWKLAGTMAVETGAKHLHIYQTSLMLFRGGTKEDAASVANN